MDLEVFGFLPALNFDKNQTERRYLSGAYLNNLVQNFTKKNQWNSSELLRQRENEVTLAMTTLTKCIILSL